MSDKNGLYNKYTVVKTETGESVTGFFLLRPDRDEYARSAIWAYAFHCREKHPELSNDLIAWMRAIERDTTVTAHGMTEEIIENWLTAANLPSITDIYKTTSPNVFYVSFDTQLSAAQKRQLAGLGFEVSNSCSSFKHRYMLTWTALPEDEPE